MSDYIESNADNGASSSSDVSFSQQLEFHSNNQDLPDHAYSSKSESPGSSSDEVDKLTARVQGESKFLPELNHSGNSSDNLTNNGKSDSPVPINNDFHNMSICELAADSGGLDQVNVDIVISNKLSSSGVSESFDVVADKNDSLSTNFVPTYDVDIITQRETPSVIDDLEVRRIDVTEAIDVASVSQSWRSSHSSIVEYLCCLDDPESPSEGENDPDKWSNLVDVVDSDNDENGCEANARNVTNEVLSDKVVNRDSNCLDSVADVTLNVSPVGFEDLVSDMNDSQENQNDTTLCLDAEIQLDNALIAIDTRELIEAVKLTQNLEVFLTPDITNHKIVNLNSLVDIDQDATKRNLFDCVVDHSFQRDAMNVGVVASAASVSTSDKFIGVQENSASLIENPVKQLIVVRGVDPTSDMLDDDDAPNSLDCSLKDFEEINEFEESCGSQDYLIRDTDNCGSRVNPVPNTMDQAVQDVRSQEDRVPTSMDCSPVVVEENRKSQSFLARDRMNRSLFDYVVDHSFRDDSMTVTASTPLARSNTPHARNIGTPILLVSTPLAQISTPPPRETQNRNLFDNIADRSSQDDLMNISLTTPKALRPGKCSIRSEKESVKEKPNTNRSLFDFAMNLRMEDNTASHRINNISGDNGVLVRDAREIINEKQKRQSVSVIEQNRGSPIEPMLNSFILSQEGPASQRDIKHHGLRENCNSQRDVIHGTNTSLSDNSMNLSTQDKVTPKLINPNRGRRTPVQSNHGDSKKQSNKVLENCKTNHKVFDSETHIGASCDSQGKAAKYCREDRVDLDQNTLVRGREDLGNQSLESLSALRQSILAKLGVLDETDVDSDVSQCREENDFDVLTVDICSQESDNRMTRNTTSSGQKVKKRQESRETMEVSDMVICVQEHEYDPALDTKNEKQVDEDNQIISSSNRCQDIDVRLASVGKQNEEMKVTPVKFQNTCPLDQVKLAPVKIKKNSSPTNRAKLFQMLMTNSSIPTDQVRHVSGVDRFCHAERVKPEPMKIIDSSPVDQVRQAPKVTISSSNSVDQAKLSPGVTLNGSSPPKIVKLAPMIVSINSPTVNQVVLESVEVTNSFSLADRVELIPTVTENIFSLANDIGLAPVVLNSCSTNQVEVELTNNSSPTTLVQLAPVELIKSSSPWDQVSLSPVELKKSFSLSDQVTQAPVDRISSVSPTNQITRAPVEMARSFSPVDQAGLEPVKVVSSPTSQITLAPMEMIDSFISTDQMELSSTNDSKLAPIKIIDSCRLTDQIDQASLVTINNSSPTNKIELASVMTQNSSMPIMEIIDPGSLNLTNHVKLPPVDVMNNSNPSDLTKLAPVAVVNNFNVTNLIELESVMRENSSMLTDPVKLSTMEMISGSSFTYQVKSEPVDMTNNSDPTDQAKMAPVAVINNSNPTSEVNLAPVMMINSCSPTDLVEPAPVLMVNSSKDHHVKSAQDEIKMELESDMNVSQNDAPLEMMNCSSQDDTDIPAMYSMNNSQDEEELFILTSVWPEVDAEKSQNYLSPASSQESIMDLDRCVESTDVDNKQETSNLLSNNYFKQSIAEAASPVKINDSNNNSNKLKFTGDGLLTCIGPSKEVTSSSSAIKEEPIHSAMIIDIPIDAPKLLLTSTIESNPNNNFQILSVKPSIGSITSGSSAVIPSSACPVSVYSLGPAANLRSHINAFKAPHAKPNAFSAKVPTSSFSIADSITSAREALKLVISANAVKGESVKKKTNFGGSFSTVSTVSTAANQIVIAAGSVASTTASGKSSASLASTTASISKAFASIACKTISSTSWTPIISSLSSKVEALEAIVTTPTVKVVSTPFASVGTFSGVKVTTPTTNAASFCFKGSTVATIPSAAVIMQAGSSTTGSSSSCIKVLPSVTTSNATVKLPTPLTKGSISMPVTSSMFKGPVSVMGSLSNAKASTAITPSSATSSLSSAVKVSPATTKVVNSAIKVSTVTTKVVNFAVKVSPATTKIVNSTVKVSPVAAAKVVNSAVKVSPAAAKVVNSAVKVSPAAAKIVPPAVKISPATSKIVPSASKISPATAKIVPSASKISAATAKVVPSAVQVSSAIAKVVPSAVQVSPATAKVVPSAVQVSPATAKVVPSAVQVSSAIAKVVPSASKISPATAKVVPSAVQVSPATAKVVPSAVKVSLPATNILPPTTSVSSTAKGTTSVPTTNSLSTSVQVSTPATSVNSFAVKATTTVTSTLSTTVKASTSAVTPAQDKVQAGKVRRSSQCLYNPHIDYFEPDINGLLLCRNRCSRKQASLSNRHLLLKPDTTQSKGRFDSYTFKRSSKEDVDRLFGKLLGGRLTDGGHEDVEFEAADVPNFDEKKTLAARIDLLMK